MLIVFDIDETLVQYMPHKYNDLWQERKHMFNENSYVEISDNGKTSVVIFRPKLEEMMNLFKNDSFFVPALWTYSERDYSEFIGNEIIKRYGLPENFFLFKKGAEDIDEDVGIPKDLNVIYEEYPEFNKFNTILVDDRYGNINNDSNMYNGLCIQPFAPFGAEKTREIIEESRFKKELNDNIFTSVIKIATAIKKDIIGCDDEDYASAFATEPVFTEKRVKRMGLSQFYQTFAVKFTNVVSVGVPYLTNKFILIPKYNKYPLKMGGKNRSKKGKRSNGRGGTFKVTSRVAQPLGRAALTIGQEYGKDWAQTKAPNVASGLYNNPSLINDTRFMMTGTKPLPKPKSMQNMNVENIDPNSENINPNMMGGKRYTRRNRRNGRRYSRRYKK
jgi:hypothetical protein